MFDFTTDFSINGKWWVPSDNEEDRKEIFGVLSYTKSGGIALTVQGSFFGSPSILKSKHHFTLPLLYGKTQDHKHITLFYLQGNEQGSNDWVYTEFAVEFALCCEHPYFGLQGLHIHKLNFSLNCFKSFLDDVMGKLQWKHPDEDELSFSYKQPPPIDIINDQDLEVYFFFSYGFSGLAGTDDFKFNSSNFMNYHYTHPVEIKQAVANLNFYKDFFTFFSYRRVSFNKVNFYGKNEDGKHVEFKFLCKDRSAEIGETTAPYDILLDYKEIEDVFPKMLQVWLSNQEAINSGLALFMQTNYLKFPSSIQSFLNLVFAIETLHNTYFQDKKMRFFQKLKDLITRSSNLVEEFIYDTDDFCNKVKVQRNHLAHDHSQAGASAIPDMYYSYFTTTLKMIYECTFLKVLGLDEKRIELYLKKHYTYQRNKRMVDELKQAFLSV